MLWVLITILASLSQTLRSVSQKNIINEVGVISSAYSRFIFALPFSVLLLVFFIAHDDPIFLQATKLVTLSWLFLASICQILFTVLLIKLFTLRSFAIGIAFSKTEVIQTTIFETDNHPAFLRLTLLSHQERSILVTRFPSCFSPSHFSTFLSPPSNRGKSSYMRPSLYLHHGDVACAPPQVWRKPSLCFYHHNPFPRQLWPV